MRTHGYTTYTVQCREFVIPLFAICLFPLPIHSDFWPHKAFRKDAKLIKKTSDYVYGNG
jgi:hypothetical protein